MEIRLADSKDKQKIIKYDNHIHHNKVGECIWNQLVYVLCDEKKIVGVLRYSLFWQAIPFLDLLYIDENYQGKGYGRQMMEYWESVMQRMKYKFALTDLKKTQSLQYLLSVSATKRNCLWLDIEKCSAVLSLAISFVTENLSTKWKGTSFTLLMKRQTTTVPKHTVMN